MPLFLWPDAPAMNCRASSPFAMPPIPRNRHVRQHLVDLPRVAHAWADAETTQAAGDPPRIGRSVSSGSMAMPKVVFMTDNPSAPAL